MKKLYQIPEFEVCMILEQDILTISGQNVLGAASDIAYDDLTKSGT